jgi:hypothetical protein
MDELPHGLTAKDLQDELDFLDSNIQVGPDITIEEYWKLVRYILRRRRRGSGAGAGMVSSIVTTPSILVVPAGSPVGTVVGTLAVVNGLGTYTFSFVSNPGGYFTIVGNQIQVASALPSPQAIPVVIQANNGLGDTPTLTTTIVIQATGIHPTYFIYGF